MKGQVLRMAFLVPLSLILVAGGCRRNAGEPVVDDGKLNVVATVAPITSIVENVVGDKVKLAGIIPEGMNSHTFEPIPSDINLVASADIIIMNGLDLEIPTVKLAEAHMKREAILLSLGDKTIQKADYIYDFSFPENEGNPNPHLWVNPQYAMRYAGLIRDELARLDPKNGGAYEANTAAFLKKLDMLDRAIQESVQTIPEGNRHLLTYHDSWPYFARRYGFRVIGAAQPSDFSDPSPREVARLIDQIRREKVPAVFGSEVFPSPVLQQIAREAGSRYVDQLRDDELPGKPGEPSHSYIGMMVENVTVMFEALGGSAKALKKIDPAPAAGAYANYRGKN